MNGCPLHPTRTWRKNTGPLTLETGREHRGEQHGQGQDEDDARSDHVEHPLRDGAPSVADDRLDVEHRVPVELLRAQPVHVDVAQVGRERDVVAAVGEPPSQGVDVLSSCTDEGDTTTPFAP